MSTTFVISRTKYEKKLGKQKKLRNPHLIINLIFCENEQSLTYLRIICACSRDNVRCAYS